MWFYVAALSPDHSDAGHAMEGHGFDAAGRYKEDAPTPASCRAEVLLVGITEGCTACPGQAHIHIAAQKQPDGLLLDADPQQLISLSLQQVLSMFAEPALWFGHGSADAVDRLHSVVGPFCSLALPMRPPQHVGLQSCLSVCTCDLPTTNRCIAHLLAAEPI